MAIELQDIAGSTLISDLPAIYNSNNNKIKTELANLNQNHSKYLTEQSLVGYATEQWVENKNYLTQHQSLNGYATQTWINQQGFLKEHQSLSGYATESFVTSQGYLKSIPNTYALKSDIPSDGHINDLINAALGVIENGTY